MKNNISSTCESIYFMNRNITMPEVPCFKYASVFLEYDVERNFPTYTIILADNLEGKLEKTMIVLCNLHLFGKSVNIELNCL